LEPGQAIVDSLDRKWIVKKNHQNTSPFFPGIRAIALIPPNSKWDLFYWHSGEIVDVNHTADFTINHIDARVVRL
ncbi:MAG: hypothetical protein ABIP54_04195, partial [Candidatus Andersenbacteria bacterium]